MAKRKYSNSTKIQPSVQKLWFAVPNWDGVSADDTRHHIDLSQCASLVNRRFYRQGVNWAVANMTLHVVNQYGQQYVKPGQSVSVNKLPNTWVMSNSWEKVFRAWKRQQDETLEDGTQESVRAKFNDFKIYMNDHHHSATFTRNLLPLGHTGGEWEAAQIVIPNYGSPGVNYEPYLMAVGPDVGGAGGTIGMIEAYANSRSVPQSPDPVAGAGVLNTANHLRAMFDVGDNNEDILENVVDKNNDLPYPQLDYIGGAVQAPGLEIHSYWNTPLTSVGTRFQMGGGTFPCGLIEVQSNITLYASDDYSGNPLENTFSFLEVTLVPGTHRGYLCEPMTEM